MRIAKEKEELNRDKAERGVQVTACERENRQQSEVISALKSDKESLECMLHETQGANATLETRKSSSKARTRNSSSRRSTCKVRGSDVTVRIRTRLNGIYFMLLDFR